MSSLTLCYPGHLTPDREIPAQSIREGCKFCFSYWYNGTMGYQCSSWNTGHMDHFNREESQYTGTMQSNKGLINIRTESHIIRLLMLSDTEHEIWQQFAEALWNSHRINSLKHNTDKNTCEINELESTHLQHPPLQLELHREHRPPPNASIIELLNDFCNAS